MFELTPSSALSGGLRFACPSSVSAGLMLHECDRDRGCSGRASPTRLRTLPDISLNLICCRAIRSDYYSWELLLEFFPYQGQCLHYVCTIRFGEVATPATAHGHAGAPVGKWSGHRLAAVGGHRSQEHAAALSFTRHITPRGAVLLESQEPLKCTSDLFLRYWCPDCTSTGRYFSLEIGIAHAYLLWKETMRRYCLLSLAFDGGPSTTSVGARGKRRGRGRGQWRFTYYYSWDVVFWIFFFEGCSVLVVAVGLAKICNNQDNFQMLVTIITPKSPCCR